MIPHAHESPAVTINILPDDIFREIFRELFIFCPSESCPDQRYWHPEAIEHTTEWQNLVHVCQRWRNIIFGSPRYLDLHLHCSEATPFGKNSNPWPEFPLTVHYMISPESDDDDVIFALEHPDRVRRVDFSIRHSDSIIHDVLEVMQVPFPALTYLDLTGPGPEDDEDEFNLPSGFLGGSAPCLQHIHLYTISFPALTKLLLSARGLVCLELYDIPSTFYRHILPEAMIGGLDGLTSLRALSIHFPMPFDELPIKKRKRGDPPMRAALPALTRFDFTGECEYLEALIAQIDAPQVEVVDVGYITSSVKKIRHLYQFVGRTPFLESARFGRALVTFNVGHARIELDRPQGKCHQARLSLTVAIEEDYYHVPRLLGRLAVMLSNVDQLSVETGLYWTVNGDRTETSRWLYFLRQFPAVKALSVTGGLAVNIALTPGQMVSETVTEVLPALRLLHLSNVDEPPGSIARYLVLRRLSGCPVTVTNTQEKFDE